MIKLNIGENYYCDYSQRIVGFSRNYDQDSIAIFTEETKLKKIKDLNNDIVSLTELPVSVYNQIKDCVKTTFNYTDAEFEKSYTDIDSYSLDKVKIDNTSLKGATIYSWSSWGTAIKAIIFECEKSYCVLLMHEDVYYTIDIANKEISQIK